MITPEIADLILRLHAHRESLGDGKDLRSDNERAFWHAERLDAARTLTALRDGPGTTKAQRLLADIELSIAAIDEKQREIENELRDVPTSFPDRRSEDHERARQDHLHLQLRFLREGRLLIAPGLTAERREVLEMRRAELLKKIAVAESAFASHVANARRILKESEVTTT
jgi:hypothetical protein